MDERVLLAQILRNRQPEELEHAELDSARRQLPSQEMQDFLAPYEHRAFAREFTAENPWVNAPAMALAAPGYELYKLLGGGKARSKPSLKAVIEALRGVGEGVAIHNLKNEK